MTASIRGQHFGVDTPGRSDVVIALSLAAFTLLFLYLLRPMEMSGNSVWFINSRAKLVLVRSSVLSSSSTTLANNVSNLFVSIKHIFLQRRLRWYDTVHDLGRNYNCIDLYHCPHCPRYRIGGNSCCLYGPRFPRFLGICNAIRSIRSCCWLPNCCNCFTVYESIWSDQQNPRYCGICSLGARGTVPFSQCRFLCSSLRIFLWHAGLEGLAAAGNGLGARRGYRIGYLRGRLLVGWGCQGRT